MTNTDAMTFMNIETEILSLESPIQSAVSSFKNNRSDFSHLEKMSKDILLYARLNYNYHLALIQPDSDNEDLFYWKNNYSKIWCIGVNTEEIGRKSILFFATKSVVDEVTFVDAVDKTSTPSFFKMNDLERITFLVDQKVIPDIRDSIIINSVSPFSGLGYWIETWIKEELTNVDRISNTPQELFDFNKAVIHAKRYNFQEMLTTIDNEQFAMEFDECLYAYNNQKWFVCAAGLGGVLEHLLYLILEKNQMIDTTFPDDATAKIYIEYLSRTPIRIKKREKTYIRTLFMTRNSVSHFNQGFTSKDQCTHLMNGIKDIFNNYYIKDFSF